MFNWMGRMLRRRRALADAGIMGMNERNIGYIAYHNPRRLFPLVDDKLKTKLLAFKYRITTPQLLGVIHSQGHVKKLESLIPHGKGFVIKPSKGSGGKGILVIVRHENGRFQKASQEWLTRRQVERHLSNLLSGLYSLGGNPDVAIIEALIDFDDRYRQYSYEGVPDIRVIVYRGYPIMAMMRLSTKRSDGKANLHQGAIGVGLNIVDGTAVRAVQYDKPISEHPDTGKALHALHIPDWTKLLELAARCYDMTKLGYLGADLVLDKEAGPQLLELNARPGLAIQIANGAGLKPRVMTIDRHLDQLRGPEESPKQRVAVIRQLFTR